MEISSENRFLNGFESMENLFAALMSCDASDMEKNENALANWVKSLMMMGEKSSDIIKIDFWLKARKENY